MGIKISMDGKGQALDNVRTEGFFRTQKYDLIYINEFDSPQGLHRSLNHYMDEYNTYRPHSSIDGYCPDEAYCEDLRVVV
ncbi:MAG: integrase core domain-containing protein [Anaerovoracaceae bacterium]|jgi:putative transposase